MTDSRVMMALGAYRFSLDTAAYQTLERRSTWRWEAVQRLGKRPAMQYFGPGEDVITLDGSIYPGFRGGFGQVDSMRAEAGKGEALDLVDGTGKAWGKYCIIDVTETRTVFYSNGLPRRIDFSLTLSMYGDA